MVNFRRKKVTFLNDLIQDEEKLRGYLDDFLKYKPRLERLYKIYPDILRTCDLFISKKIFLNEDTPIPDDFLCTCKLLGLKIKEVKEEISYSDNHDYYMVITFNGVNDCNE